MYKQTHQFSQRSLRYRKAHMDAMQTLYGDKPATLVKPSKKLKAKRSPPTQQPEYCLQVKLVSWARSEGLDLISIPNSGRRSWAQGKKEVAMGLTAGVSDLFLAEPCGVYGGFWIELKAPGKKPTELQLAWLQKMQRAGYFVAWFDNFELAQQAIKRYIGMA